MQTRTIYQLKFKRLLLVVVAFLFAQLSSFAHAHDDHAETTPDHQPCAVCLIATESEGDVDVDVDVDNDDRDIERVDLTYLLPPDNFEFITDRPLKRPANSAVERLCQTDYPYLLSRAPPAKLSSII